MKKYIHILRVCDEKLKGYGGFQWPKKGRVSAPDWIKSKEYGNGLHGWLLGCGSINAVRDPLKKTNKWLVVKVLTRSIIDLGDMVKYPRGNVLFCGNRDKALAFLGIVENLPRVPHFFKKEIEYDYSTLTGGDYSTLTGGDYSTLTGGNDSKLEGGHRSKLKAGNDSTLKAGNDSKLEGGDYSMLKGGDRSKLIGCKHGALRGGRFSNLMGDVHTHLSGGYGSTFTGGKNARFTWLGDNKLLTGMVGHDGLQPDVAYTHSEDFKTIIEAGRDV